MLTDNSTQNFIRKLCEKQREHTTKLYTESFKDKQNVSKKANIKPNNNTSKKMRTESSSTIASTSSSTVEWGLDITSFQKQQLPELLNDWLCLPEGMFRFHRIYRGGDWEQQLSKRIGVCEANTGEHRKCMIIQINAIDKEVNFTSLLTKYSLPLLKCGKSSWSLAALSVNRKYDLLSLDSEGSPLWKGKTPLSKVQLQRQQLLRRVFGYASQKQKSLNIQQILAKIVLPSRNIIYFILKTPEVSQPVSKLLIEQQIIIQGITVFHKYSNVFLQSAASIGQGFSEVLKSIGIPLKREEQLSKSQKESYLKSMISKLQGQLHSQQAQLQQYIQSEIIQEEQYPIPSQRISMSQKYSQLQRNIKHIQYRS